MCICLSTYTYVVLHYLMFLVMNQSIKCHLIFSIRGIWLLQCKLLN